MTTTNVKAKEQVIDKDVRNAANEDLGSIKEVVIDKTSGRVAYAVLESDTFLGLGGKLFALPWSALNYNTNDKCFIVNIDKEKLKNAPGFDKGHWPEANNREFISTISTYYGTKPYWEETTTSTSRQSGPTTRL
jgi:hypothetical protein